MKYLIAGYGSIGRRHMRNLLALGERDILLYRTMRSTLQIDELAGFKVETNLDAALAHHPDAIIIANPTALHVPTAIPAVSAGCNVLMEKPVSHNLEGVDELRIKLQQNHKKLLMAFQFRYHPGLQHIRRLLDERVVGKVVSVRAHWGEYLPNWHPWEDFRKSYTSRVDLGGGVVHTLSHPFDYLRFLLGNIDSVTAITSMAGGLEIEVESVAEIGLQFSSGVIGSVHLDYLQRPPEHTLKIIGENGTVCWDNSDGVVKVYSIETGVWSEIHPPEGFERNELFIEELHHFKSVINGEAEPICTLDDGVRAVEIALAVQRSAHSGQQVKIG
jgi:predicted dehydrogenase